MKKPLIFLSILFITLFTFTSIDAQETPFRVYFYNSGEWETVHAYIWGEPGETLGSWPGENAIQEEDSDWWYIETDTAPPFNIIFNNGGSAQAGGAFIANETDVFTILLGDESYSSKTEAEAAQATLMDEYDPSATTTVWFYNSQGWRNVHYYVYGTIESEPLGGWPGLEAEREGDSHWYKLDVPAPTPFSIIVNDGTDPNRSENYIEDETRTYLTIESDVQYPDKQTAEATIDEVLPISEPVPSDPIDHDSIDFEDARSISLPDYGAKRTINTIFITTEVALSIIALTLFGATFYMKKRL